MLERQIKPEGGVVYCDLGRLCPEAGQTIDCSLVLAGVLPERRVALSAELLDGDTCLGARLFAIPPHHKPTATDLRLTGLRFYLPEGTCRTLTLRADAHYMDRNERCLL
ncbi:hypothetical protein B5G34_03685 [Flavonifractor sp. An82]|uniref:hypothetical protein n=1 Tax=Flavonifractor sp. An82 TaxID=1965660 RepID=UPI000B37EF82|nr:hypothetical protein [Flavonifractor sp. An82]OUN23104.1 hypothetical protein B5G34_03685 [Flavonifractor sp. An82]